MLHHLHETGFSDTPVTSMKDDLFNVMPYVSGLCSFIRVCKTPMTISIQGDWGSGKTSMMNMIKSQLEDTVIPIEFNTWQFSQFDMGNQLAFSMMYVLLKGLKCETHTKKEILRNMAVLGRGVLKMAATTLAGSAVAQAADTAIGVSSNVVKVASGTIAGSTASHLADNMLLGGNHDYAAQITELKSKFENAVAESLSKAGKDRVVVFVDDLDRLQPSKAVELLEVLKETLIYSAQQSCLRYN